MQLTRIQDLAAAIGFEGTELISVVGGGGKTTTVFGLGRQLEGPRVLTTTTKMGSDRTDQYRLLIGPSDAEVAAALGASGAVLVWGAVLDHRADGVAPERCDAWFEAGATVIVEADGSRRRPFKAPADYEPVVPARTTTLLTCIGASAIGRPIADGCHRPDLVAALLDCSTSEPLTPARAATVLLSERGSRKGLPAGARQVVLIHQVRGDDAAPAELVELVADAVPVLAVAALD